MWMAVLKEVIDFLLKAGSAYLQTPQGQKEWADIRAAALKIGKEGVKP